MKVHVIRYRKPEWENWVTITVTEFEYPTKVKLLKELGYIVEEEE